MVHPALDRLVKLLDSTDERIGLQAVRVVLDKAVLDMATGEGGEPLGMPLPTKAQLEEWIAQLEAEAHHETNP